MKTHRLKLAVMLTGFAAFGCFNPKDYDTPPVSSDSIWWVSGNAKDVLANGATAAKVVAQISDKAAPGRRTVVFRTTSGAFVGGKGDSIAVEVDQNFRASAELTNTSPGEAAVYAKIRGVSTVDSVRVNFIQVYPTKILSVTVDSFAVRSNYKSEVWITATLSADKGIPSVGHPVTFSATQLDGKTSVGGFLNNNPVAKTDASGKARIRYSPGVTTYQNFAIIKATITTKKDPASTDTTSNTTRIYILN